MFSTVIHWPFPTATTRSKATEVIITTARTGFLINNLHSSSIIIGSATFSVRTSDKSPVPTSRKNSGSSPPSHTHVAVNVPISSRQSQHVADRTSLISSQTSPAFHPSRQPATASYVHDFRLTAIAICLSSSHHISKMKIRP